MLATLFLLAQMFDLTSVKAEVNLDRRADLALLNANASLDRAKAAYSNGEYKQSTEAVLEIRDSIEVCNEALKATGKDPRRNSKQFKKVELRLQTLIRRVKGFAQGVSIEDRALVQQVQARLEEINDDMVSGIFTKSK